MADAFGIFGQAAPGAGVDTDLYTVPAAKHATVRVVCANRSTATTVRVWVGVNGAATANAQYVAYDAALAANGTLTTVPILVGSTDVVRVRAASADVSFNCTGIEQDD